MRARIPVLFLQSQEYFGSDSMIQSLLAGGLDRERYEIHVACSPGPAGSPSASWQALSKVPNIRLIPVNFGPSIFAQTTGNRLRNIVRGMPAALDIPRLVVYARRHGIRIVHGTEKPRDALTSVMVARAIGARSVVHLHVKCHEGLSGKQTFALRHADAIVAVSKFVADSVIAKGYSPEKVHFVVNGLDSAQWTSAARPADLTAEFGLPADAQVITIASRLFVWKGHAELLRALAAISAEHPRAHLLIVGDDDPRAHPGKTRFSVELERLANRLGLTDRVHFTGFRTDVREILAASDIYAMPTFEEPCAVAFLEAMAMGKAIVALDSGGTPEMITNGVTGLLSPVGDISALAGNLSRLLRSPEERARLGLNAAHALRADYTPERMCRDLDRIYREILGVPHGVDSPAALAV